MIPENAHLLTLVVASLYTNIPHDEGLKSVRFYVENRDHAENPPNQFIINLATFVMKYDYFSFDKDFFSTHFRDKYGLGLCS